ncbi:MAG TPA: lytic transglycosylase domain-containing protein [Rhizomicrobium sp.]|nr:lytic transglycosylase domain-containing protein [Rhizomicrobium sp.]
MTTNSPLKTIRAEVSARSLSSSNTTRVLSALVLATGIVAGLRTSHISAPNFHPSTELSAAVAAHKPVAPKTLALKMPDLSKVFAQEEAMSTAELIKRWDPIVSAASKQFHVSKDWIRAVMRMESGGRTMLDERFQITSYAGAMGLMQVMPETYREMRAAYKLGADPYNPHDNIFAGTAYLAELHRKYGYPAMFAAYNDGPGNWEDHVNKGRPLPAETVNYVSGITGGHAGHGGGKVQLTQPDGNPVEINLALVRSVRAPLPGEFADTVQAVVTLGKKQQGVRETVEEARRLTLS